MERVAQYISAASKIISFGVMRSVNPFAGAHYTHQSHALPQHLCFTTFILETTHAGVARI